MRMMSTWHRISSIFNHQKIHSIFLSFSCTSFLSIFYQKMITCNLVILQFILYIIPWKQAGRQPRLHIMQWSRWTDNWSVSTFISSNHGECSCLLHFATMSIELASVCITHWIKKFLCFRVSIYLEHLQNVYC